MVRVTVGGDDLTGFTSQGFDDHIKLVFTDEEGRA
jgi:NADPH-dependent ferric siderophore reductase